MQERKRLKISISFPRDREHVWEAFADYCQQMAISNQSAAAIGLLEKALASPAVGDDETAGLYELERLSKQLDEYHQRIEELTERVCEPWSLFSRTDSPPVQAVGRCSSTA